MFLLPGFVGNKTPVPVDHAMMIPPWNTLGDRPIRNPNLNDIALQIAPWAKAVRMAWKEGSLPLRDRWNSCGMPLAANGLSAAFSPFTFLMFALPLGRAFTLAAALKLFLALTGTWLWLRELKVSANSALVGAAAFSFSLTMTPPWLFYPQTTVIGLWPWCLLAIELLRDEKARRKGFWALVALFALWPLCGHVESAALGAIFIGLWLLARWAARDLPDAPAVFLRIALASVVALGLSAFALLPHVLTIIPSSRVINAAKPFWSDFLSWVPHRPAFPYGFFTTFFPRSLGDAITSPMVPGAAGSFPEMTLGYFGIAGWACVLLLLRPGSSRRPAGWTLLVPLISGFGVAVALWPFGEIVSLVPVLKMMFPLRFFNLIPLAGAAIAAFELDRFQKDLSTDRKTAAYPVLVASLLALFAVAAFFKFRDAHLASKGLASQQNSLLLTLGSLAGFAAIASAAALKRRPWASAFAPLVGAILSLELFWQGTRLYQFGSPAYLFPETPLIRYLRQQPPPFRVLGEGSTLFPNSNVFAGLEDIRTHDGVERRDYVEFLDATCGYSPAEYFKFIKNTNASALDFLNVRYLVSAPGSQAPGAKWRLVYSGADGTVFENRAVFPRVFAPKTTEVIANRAPGFFLESAATAYGKPLQSLVAGRNWRETAVVLSDGAGEFQFENPNNDRLTVREWRETTNAISFRAVVSGDRPVTAVASLVQDGGWSAFDGTGWRIPMARANGPFTALLLPPGEHLVRMTYSTPGFRTGVGISVVTFLGIALFLVIGVRRRQVRAVQPR